MRRLVICAIGTLMFLAVAIALSGCAAPAPEVIVVTATPASTVTPAPTVVPTLALKPTSTPRPTAAPVMSVSDFAIELLVTEKQCFGSAGCVYTFEPQLSFVGDDRSNKIQAEDEYLVIYEVRNTRDGIAVFNLTAYYDTYVYDAEMVSMPPGIEPIAVITRIVER